MLSEMLNPVIFAMVLSGPNASLNNGDSLRFPAAVTKGAIILQLRSQKATIVTSNFIWL